MLNFFRKNKIVILSATLLCLVFLLVPNQAHAFFDFAEDVQDFLNGVTKAIAMVLMAFTALLLNVAGMVLEAIIRLSILGMKAFLENNVGVSAVWRTFRDLSNMFFIFILLYVAIGTILNLGNVDMKKMLVRVVIVSLLLNFSFFFTKVAVDASNILSIGFYNEILKTKCGTGSQGSENLGVAFQCKLGLTSVWDATPLNNIVAASKGDPWMASVKILIYGLMNSIFFIIAAFVFFAAGVMFIARFVTLIFLFILSPLAFMSMALPNDKYSGEWFEKLTSNCIFAPAFMVTVWAVLHIANAITAALGAGTGTATLATAVTGDAEGKAIAGAGNVFLSYGLLIAMLIGALIVASKTGGYGASGALKMLKGGAAKATGWAARNTVGRAALALDKRLEKSGFDGRTSRFFRDMTTGAVAGAKFGGTMSRKEDKKRVDELKKDIADKKQQRTNTGDLDRHAETIKENQAILSDPTMVASHAAAQTAIEAAKGEAERIISRMSNKELESAGFKKLLAHIDLLNPEQLAHVTEKSDKFGEHEKAQLKDARFKSVANQVATNGPNVRKEVRALDSKEIELMEPSIVGNPTFINNMSESQVENLLKSSKVTASLKKKVRDEKARPFKTAVAAAPAPLPAGTIPTAAQLAAISSARTAIAAELAKMKPQKVAKLDASDLTNEHVMSQLTPAMLSKMPDELDAADLQKIGTWIKNNAYIPGTTTPSPAYEYITTGLGKGLF